MELGDHAVALGIGVVDEEAAVGREVRMEGEAKQATLATCADPAADVEPRRAGRRLTLGEPVDLTGLRHHVKVARAIAGIGDKCQRREAARQ